MRGAWLPALALLLVAARPCGGEVVGAADAPRVRPLEPQVNEIPPPPDVEPARPLPSTVAICHDVAARRCWTAARAEDCGGVDRVFRVVIGGAGGPDAVTALAQCRAAPAAAN